MAKHLVPWLSIWLHLDQQTAAAQKLTLESLIFCYVKDPSRKYSNTTIVMNPREPGKNTQLRRNIINLIAY